VLRKQTPIPPYPYEEKEVEFINKHDGTKLSGSLTYPQNGAQFPSVILITGASPQDRNEEGFGGHRFFQVLADDLTKRGIAVLRYDDRGFGKSTGNYDSASIFDFSNDAEAGLDFLKTVPFIDHNKIGLLGHSEGGYVALIVASRRSDVSFIVSMAGPFMPGIDVLRFQHKGALERMAALGERGDEKIPALLDETLNIIIKEDDITVIKNKIEILMKNAAISDEMKKSIIEMYSTPESIFAVKSNPADYLAKINCPILSLGGTRDMAVPVKENQEALKKIMSKLGRANYEMVEFPDMNHFFQTTANGMFYFVPQIQETMAPLAMQTIGEWILRITKATCDSYCHLFYRYSYFPLRVE
jgi:pimeloyl-ACP methyl ester carboxylesterase